MGDFDGFDDLSDAGFDESKQEDEKPMRLPNRLRSPSADSQSGRRKPWPIMLVVTLLIIGVGYSRSLAIAASWGDSGGGLAGLASFIMNMGVIACVASIGLLISCVRRERFWPISLLSFAPIAGYAAFFLIFLLPRFALGA